MIEINFQDIDTSDYFDLTSKNLDEISIAETKSKHNCYIKSEFGHIYKGFKLSNKPQVNIYCSLGFYPSKNTGKYIPRPTFFKMKDDFQVREQIEKEKVIVALNDSDTAENFWKLVGFLHKFTDLVDIGDFEKSFQVIETDAYIIRFKDKGTAEKVKALQTLFEQTDFSEKDIELILRDDRKKNLQRYYRLLDSENSWEEYQEKYKNEMRGVGEEAVWHHFLKKHHWLLGLNADLKFIRDFINEADIGVKDTTGKGSPSVDMLGISDFTTLVELKTPNTKIFTERKVKTARANTWSFTAEFIDGISQCLAQKTDWEKTSKPIVQSNNQELDQTRHRTLDPKAIFIIGNKKTEIPENSKDVDVLCKRDTLERFRRNNRNLEIITFDELYERASYIVNGNLSEI